MNDLQTTLQRLLGINQLKIGLTRIYDLLKVQQTYIEAKFMALEDSIARLEQLVTATSEAVKNEATEATAINAAKDKALADAQKTVEELKGQLANSSIDPALSDRLSGIADKFQKNLGEIGGIVNAINLTPVSDLVTKSVQSDSAPTPPDVQSVVVTANDQTPVQAATSAATAISDAVEEVTTTD